MEKINDVTDFLQKVRETPTNDFHFAARKKDPGKNPEILMELLGFTREQTIEDVVKQLQPGDFVKTDQNKSPGHTAPVWVFKKKLSYEDPEGKSTVESYVKLSIEVVGTCTIISFHKDQ
jgi:hypothetical protein